MNERIDDRAQAEARHDMAAHPDRRPAQDEVIRVYLAVEAYVKSHDHPSEKATTEETRDEQSADGHGAAG